MVDDHEDFGATDYDEAFTSEFADRFQRRLGDRLHPNLDIASRVATRNTAAPQVGDVWRVRWLGTTGAVLVVNAAASAIREVAPVPVADLRVAPVSFDGEPDDSAVLAAGSTNDLGFDVTVWVTDEAVVPTRVLECKLGRITSGNLEQLPRGTRNWGPTDPRSRVRARLQDIIDELMTAAWAPDATADESLSDLLAAADLHEVAHALGSVSVAMQLRRGHTSLTPDQAVKLVPVLDRTPEELLAAGNPALPDELITVMDQPNVRSLVDRLAVDRGQDEVTAWRSAAYGVLALAAREQRRAATPGWAGRVGAYFDALFADAEKPRYCPTPEGPE